MSLDWLRLVFVSGLVETRGVSGLVETRLVSGLCETSFASVLCDFSSFRVTADRVRVFHARACRLVVVVVGFRSLE